MILPFQNLKVMLNTSRDSTITPGGLISNRRLSTVTFHAKTYTNGFVLNGQKPTAN